MENLDLKQYLFFSNFNIVYLFLFCIYFALGNNILLLFCFKFTTLLDGDECTASFFLMFAILKCYNIHRIHKHASL